LSDVAYIPKQDTDRALRTRQVSVGGRNVLMHYHVLSDITGTALRTSDSKLRTSSMPYTYDIAEGNVADHTPMRKFGNNADVGAAWETIWSGSNTYPFMTSADQLEVVSDSAEDDSGGTGALTMRIEGLDANYEVQTSDVTLDAANVKTTTETYIRVYRAYILTAGSTGANVGAITIRDQDTDTTRALIDAGVGQTLMAVYTVPADYTGYITSWYVSSSISKQVDSMLQIRELNAAWNVKRYITMGAAIPFFANFDFPEKIPEKTDIRIQAKAGGGGGAVSAGFFLWYEAN